ncbi:lamin tail domain-containing protein [Streptomyces sp. Tu 2975]|uniref:lamin tail domain-containing protein n=1 Tax=Streptomyces sp. Tu 2975 TaxID=2676871 RepID=UPI001359B5AE|nr:lamin tail domain-containing protein [Streptomyces sp. Tu 2975]QIP83092.1 lamin tail domain-containing protein [Streptomyces sp. Tu 2975]
MSAASTSRRIAAAVLAAGAVVSAVTLPASAHDGDRRHRQDARVEISAVQTGERDHRSNRALNAEWVEITNNSRRSVNLDGWTLRDRDGNRYSFDDYRLAGRSSVRVHTGFGRDSRTDLYQDRRHSVWDKRSDKATLRDDRGHTVDTESWGRGHRR